MIAPGPLLATVTQFVPAVREAGTAEQRARFLGAVAAGELHRLARDRRADAARSIPPHVTATVAFDGDDAVLTGDEALRRRRRRGRRARRRRARAAGTSGDDGVRAVVVPGRRDAHHAACTRSTAAAGSRTSTSTASASQRDRVLGDPDASAAAGAAARARGSHGRDRARDGRHRADDLRRHARLREAARAVRRADRLVPGDQAQVRRHDRRRSSGPAPPATSPRSRSPRTTPGARRATSVAKAAAGDCQRLLGKEGIQIHGGIGYTWEHDMHLYVKRVKSLRAALRHEQPGTGRASPTCSASSDGPARSYFRSRISARM